MKIDIKVENEYMYTSAATGSKSGELTIVKTALIQMTYVDLNRSMILSSNQSVCSRTEKDKKRKKIIKFHNRNNK
jgi:hypothetical protein